MNEDDVIKALQKLLEAEVAGKKVNETQVAVLACFTTAMQAFTEVWQSQDSTTVTIVQLAQRAAAYGGASFLTMLAVRTTDVNKHALHAAALLDQAAKQLGLPASNQTIVKKLIAERNNKK